MEMSPLSTCDHARTTWGQCSAGAMGLGGALEEGGEGMGLAQGQTSYHIGNCAILFVSMPQLWAAATPGAQLSQAAAP